MLNGKPRLTLLILQGSQDNWALIYAQRLGAQIFHFRDGRVVATECQVGPSAAVTLNVFLLSSPAAARLRIDTCSCFPVRAQHYVFTSQSKTRASILHPVVETKNDRHGHADQPLLRSAPLHANLPCLSKRKTINVCQYVARGTIMSYLSQARSFSALCPSSWTQRCARCCLSLVPRGHACVFNAAIEHHALRYDFLLKGLREAVAGLRREEPEVARWAQVAADLESKQMPATLGLWRNTTSMGAVGAKCLMLPATIMGHERHSPGNPSRMRILPSPFHLQLGKALCPAFLDVCDGSTSDCLSLCFRPLTKFQPWWTSYLASRRPSSSCNSH